MGKLNKVNPPSIDERRKKSYKLKVSLSHAYVKVCDKLNPAQGKIYQSCKDVIDRDETIELGWKDREMLNYGPNGLIVRSLTEDESEILNDFTELFSDKMDEIMGLKPCNRG